LNPSTALGAGPAIVLYIDGGARGNPGPAGFGVRVERPDGSLVEEFGESIGVATNNVAEYRALVAALGWAKTHGHRAAHVRSDSLLLVQQMLGNYKVKNPGLQPLHGEAQRLAREIGRVTFEHVGRALNAHADRLANAAMDGASSDPQPSAPAAQRDPFSRLERTIRLFVYDQFVATGTAPDLAAIAAGARVTEPEAASALRRLADMHALVLAPSSTNIWMAHPFSAVPTAYPVDARGRTYYANCAWDAAGILALVGDGESRATCGDCGADLRVAVRGGHIAGDGIVHFAVPPRRFWDNIAFT
jgi:probable phosphoglycerate mutase